MHTASWLKGIGDPYNAQRTGGSDNEENKGLIRATSPGRTLKKQASFRQVSCADQFKQECKAFFFDTKLNLLLIALPFAFIAKIAHWGDAFLFVFSMIALTPLAERLGFVTEQLAMFTNDTLGGLLNASFGNATEVIISAFALKHGLLRVVQLSLLGSIVSNLLMVMGTAFIAGGIRNSQQQFNQQGINVNSGLLLLACFAIVLPSLLSETHTEVKDNGKSELALSRFESLLLLICYGLFLLFQLYTHRYLYDEDAKGEDDKDSEASGPSNDATTVTTRPMELEMQSTNGLGTGASPRASVARDLEQQDEVEDKKDAGDDDDEEECVLSLYGCFMWLTGVTILIAILSEFIVDAITGASKALRIPMPFLTTILLPIVGNAAEHASAIIFAWKNRIEIALGVAVGSATQIGVLVVPFCVVLAWMMGEPLDLNFNSFETTTLFISVLLAIVVMVDGTSNWLKGVLLLLTYLFIAGGFWCHKDVDLTLENPDGGR